MNSPAPVPKLPPIQATHIAEPPSPGLAFTSGLWAISDKNGAPGAEDLRRAERLAIAAHKEQRATSLRGPAAAPSTGPMARATSRDGRGGGKRAREEPLPRRKSLDFMAVSGAATLPSIT